MFTVGWRFVPNLDDAGTNQTMLELMHHGWVGGAGVFDGRDVGKSIVRMYVVDARKLLDFSWDATWAPSRLLHIRQGKCEATS